jgi:hypothetical protein
MTSLKHKLPFLSSFGWGHCYVYFHSPADILNDSPACARLDYPLHAGAGEVAALDRRQKSVKFLEDNTSCDTT